jgi:formimidoylglutamate deiminase
VCIEFEHLHQPDGWLSPGYLQADAHGIITEVAAARPAGWPERAERVTGYAIPGMSNVHSHAFQRALAGFTEHKVNATDTFWTWREAMYQTTERLTPDALEDISAMAFLEMLRAGYTAVGEFHYLHRNAQGQVYSDPAELSWRVLAAAARVGLGLTFLPALYLHGGFGKPLQSRQQRFAHAGVDAFLDTVARVRSRIAERRLWRLGVAPHSLRAVDERALHTLVKGLDDVDPALPIHIHVAEQRREVEECRAALDARPVAFLLSRFQLGPRWCLVHATHLDDGEQLALAHSEATAGLCPTTEANLGDGVFATDAFLAARGSVGIGSDSQIEIDPCAELRLLEYSQRLRREQRAVLTGSTRPAWHVGRFLWETACQGGARALAQPIGTLSPGRRADVVVLDPEHDRMLGHDQKTALDAFVFSAGRSAVRDVFVGGRKLIEGGRHRAEDEIRAGFRRAMQGLQASA